MSGWLAVGIYIGKLIVDPSVLQKLNTKHQVTEGELRESFEWPADVQVGTEDHPVHGHRWVALGRSAESRLIIAYLLPAPAWEAGRADTWVTKSARWL